MSDDGDASSIDLSRLHSRQGYLPEDDNDEDEDESDDDNWVIPPPPAINSRRGNINVLRSNDNGDSSALHPLNGGKPRSLRSSWSNSFKRKYNNGNNLLFGDSGLDAMSRPNEIDSPDNKGRPSGLAGFFFAFMYEDRMTDASLALHDDDSSEASGSVWNFLNVTLFIAFSLTTAAAAVPIILIPTMGQDLLEDSSDVSVFTSQAAASAVLGTACGKFVNGPVGDVLGARRTSVLYSFLLSLTLLGMTFCGSTSCAAWACFYVEFFQSVQWPCMIVVLATHYRPSSHQHMYEGGIYVTSVASRFGSLLGIPLYSYLLRRSHWRIVCLVGAWVSLIACSVAYLFISDSPNRVNEPQNALHPSLQQQIATTNIWAKPRRFFMVMCNVVKSIVTTNLIPSLDHVLKSGTFWIVALAHTGSSMVRTSERILGTYFRDTSMGTLSENRAGSLAVFAPLGTILGLSIAGSMFTQRKERQRKWLVSRLYIITIAACYMLAILAIPRLRYILEPDLLLFFQVFASFVMSFGIAVMFYHIPGLVGAAFGNNKGLFSAYTDGVAYLLSSIVWRVVASAVEGGDPNSAGWAYGWAAVALLIVLCAILMVEFMEHYFVRASGRHHGSYETIIFA
jgi:MFS family permease